MTYEMYKSLGGNVSEEEFSSLVTPVYDFLQSYVESYVSLFDLRKNINDYGDFDMAIVYQIDFTHENGGTRVFNGNSDTDVESVTSSGYTYKVGNNLTRHNGIPISPLTKSLIMKELRKNGYLKRVIS